METRSVPVDSIIEAVCARKGCHATVLATTLVLPGGWRHIIIANGSLFEHENLLKADRDGILCPNHVDEVQSLFK